MAIDTFIWKIASRCNLNCDYCYVYNAGDDSWRAQPKLMDLGVAEIAATRIRDYALKSGLNSVDINFHGGEPLLGGVRHLRSLLEILRATFDGSGVTVSSAIQSNAVLYTPEVGELLTKHGVTLYVSFDGPAVLNDVHRLDVRGQPTYSRIEAALVSLTEGPYRGIFGGFLAVIDPRYKPSSIIDELARFDPPMVDFLLPLRDWDKPSSLSMVAYTDWLNSAFQYVHQLERPMRVRLFDNMILGALGIGEDVSGGYLVVETDGSLELDDTLKASASNLSILNYNICDSELHRVQDDPRVVDFQAAQNKLCQKCRQCRNLDACGGGHIGHRFSRENGFDNPSVYCEALFSLADSIKLTVSKDFGLFHTEE